MKEALRDALQSDTVWESVEGTEHLDSSHLVRVRPRVPADIARTICTTLGITREMVRTKATNQWTIDILTALLDLAEGDT